MGPDARNWNMQAQDDIRREFESKAPARGADDATRRLGEACLPFVGFLAWVEALAELGEVGPIDDGSVVCQAMGGGGHDALRIGDFRNLRDAFLGAVPPIRPDGVGF